MLMRFDELASIYLDKSQKVNKISSMGSFGLQNSCHPVWQRVVELVDDLVRDDMEGNLAGIPKLLQVLQLGPTSFLLHSSPDMLNNIHIWRLCWPSLKDFDLLPPEKLHSGAGGMARSSILLKNQDLPGTSVLDVTPNHNLSTSKFDCLLGEPWVQMGRRQYWRRLGWSSTDDSSEKSILHHFTAVQTSVRLWALVYATRFLSGLLFSAGFWAAIRPWRPLRARIRRTVLVETGVAGVHSPWSCEVVDMGLALDSQAREQLSCTVCPTWVCDGRRQSLGSTYESSSSAV